MNKEQIGKVIHFYPKISVAVVELSEALKTGDRISIERGGDSFEQEVGEMQMEHKSILEAGKGQSVGLKVASPTHEGAKVFRVAE